MNLEFNAADEAFRAEVRAFLATHLDDELREAARLQTTALPEKAPSMRWQRILHEKKGWAAPTWPEAFGGPGWSANQRYIFTEECARAGAPGLIPLGTRMLAPVLFRYGTPEQQAHYLPRMLRGEDYWCQGYSEPGSGSDLSSLKTTAIADGDDYIVNGTKLWTTHGHLADHIFCLVRTDQSTKPQRGISFLLIDMSSPGISVKPIVTIAGDHEVNQVFFDDVRVPQANRVGPENDGWTVAKYLLEFERGAVGAAPGLEMALVALREQAGRRDEAGTCLLDEPGFRQRLDELDIALQALRFNELKTLARVTEGASPGPESSLLKITSVDLGQAIETLHLEAVDYHAVPHQRRLQQLQQPPVGPAGIETVSACYLNGRAASIFGGTREVQKNIIAKTVLGL